MKNIFSVLAFVIGLFATLYIQNAMAQSNGYKVVFDITSSDSTDHQSLIRWLTGISKSNPDAQMEVVFYGRSLPMVTMRESGVANEIQTLAKNKNISFRVCEIAMKRHQITKSDLLPGVETVPDGIAEIVQRQTEGWGYIKAGR